MASHYVLTSAPSPFNFIKLYKTFSTNSQVLTNLANTTEIDVLEEYVGTNCDYHYVSSSFGNGYVLNKFVFPLEGTAESAPYTCNIPAPNLSYVEPDWQNLTDVEPYLNGKTNEYSVCITSNFLTPSEIDESEILYNGIKALFKFYNKPYDNDTIQKFIGYYIFAKVKDSFVPTRPLARVKYLVTIPAKYFNVIEEDANSQSITPFEKNILEAQNVLKFDLKLMNKLFDSLHNKISLYNDDLLSNNSFLSYDTSEIFGEVANSAAFGEIDFSEKADNILKFKNELDNLLSLNKINSKLPIDSPKEIILEFYINDECNQIYDVAAVINKKRVLLRVGIEKFLLSEAATDQTIVNFVKNINTISRLEKCKVSWNQFSESYVFPKPKIQQNIIDGTETKFETTKKLNSIFYSAKQATSINPIKSTSNIMLDQQIVSQFQNNKLFIETSNPLSKTIYQGDVDFDPTNVQKILTKIEASISENTFIARSLNAIEIDGQFYEVLSINKNLDLASAVGIIGQLLPLPKEVFKLDTETPRITIPQNGIDVEVNLLFSPKDLQIQQLIDLAKEAAYEQLNKLMQELLEKIGIYKLIDLLKSILMSICKSLEIPLDFSLDLGAIGSFNYDELLNDLLPYLPLLQQQFLFENMLLELGSINKNSLTNLLKKYLNLDEIKINEFDFSQVDLTQINFESVSLEQIINVNYDFNQLNINQNDINKIVDSIPYETIVKEVAKRMAVSIVRQQNVS